ncbi:MAG: peptidase [Parcubacteria group bacterium]|nr:peptidase [Parcubacteria group bacterium]
MKIGITQRSIEDNILGKYDALEQNYVKYFSKFKIDIIPIPNIPSNVENFIRSTGIKKIILSGGDNIDPRSYGSKKIKGFKYSSDRDSTEYKLMKYAIKTKMPVLGICRGSQFINVFFGGKIIQDLKHFRSDYIDHVKTIHKVILDGDKNNGMTREKSILVNSYHNGGFTKNELGRNLKIFAESTDGIVEGYYHKILPIVGIMWHPERKNRASKFDYKLINSFINGKNRMMTKI